MSEFVQSASFYVEGKEIEIFKSNALVEGAFDLSPAEHDLMTLAINKLFSQGIGGKQVFISAKEFATANQINANYAYEVLAETATKLHKRKFKTKIYKDDLKRLAGDEDPYSIARPKGKHELMDLHASWVQAVAYHKETGFIALMFSDVLAYLIQKTGEAYTKYPYEKTIDLKRFHTKRLYELCCKWAGAKPPNGKKYPQITMVVDEWRDFFGCTDKYDKIAEFKRRVIEPVVKEINEQGEYELTLEQEKIGKIITHFTLIINDKRMKNHPLANALTPNKERDDNTADMFNDGLTDKELQIIKATADKYIAEKGITDLGHKQNIYKKAKEGRWGLADLDKQTAELQAQNIKITEQIQAEKQAQQRQEQEKAGQERTNKEFIEYFESLPFSQQAEILTEVKAKVEKLPIIGQNFIENMATSYKDVMYRSYFKKVMGLI